MKPSPNLRSFYFARAYTHKLLSYCPWSSRKFIKMARNMPNPIIVIDRIIEPFTKMWHHLFNYSKLNIVREPTYCTCQWNRILCKVCACYLLCATKVNGRQQLLRVIVNSVNVNVTSWVLGTRAYKWMSIVNLLKLIQVWLLFNNKMLLTI